MTTLAEYRRLCDEVRLAYDYVVSSTDYRDCATGSSQFIWQQARAFLDAYPKPTFAKINHRLGAVSDVLSLMVGHWRDLAAGEMTGGDLFRRTPGLWRQWMSQWPLGEYAEMVAPMVARACEGRTTTVLELGAGVQYTTTLVRGLAPQALVRPTDLIYEGDDHLDIQAPFCVDPVDVVYATNAVHCSDDPSRTLDYCFDALRHGGTLVLGEGGPEPLRGEPWALDGVCGLMDGWWDRGRFRTPTYWRTELRKAGFGVVTRHRLGLGDLDLGGCWVARRP